MKRVTALLLAAMMIITTGLITPAMAAEDDVPETYSNAYVVMDAKTGQVLLQKNMYEKEYPASITKILTTALGLTYAKPESPHHRFSGNGKRCMEVGRDHPPGAGAGGDHYPEGCAVWGDGGIRQ